VAVKVLRGLVGADAAVGVRGGGEGVAAQRGVMLPDQPCGTVQL
jgi:hypothetical protein